MKKRKYKLADPKTYIFDIMEFRFFCRILIQLKIVILKNEVTEIPVLTEIIAKLINH